MEFFLEGDKSNTGTYIDGYLQTRWTYEGKKEIEKKIEEVYGNGTKNFLDYTFRYNNKEFKNLNCMEVLEKCNGNVYVNISYYIFGNEKLDKQIEAEKAYKVLKTYLLDYKVQKYNFNIIFLAEECRKEFIANGNTTGKKSYDDLYKEGLLRNFLKVYNLKNTHPVEINSSSDLVKWFQY